MEYHPDELEQRVIIYNPPKIVSPLTLEDAARLISQRNGFYTQRNNPATNSNYELSYSL